MCAARQASFFMHRLEWWGGEDNSSRLDYLVWKQLNIQIEYLKNIFKYSDNLLNILNNKSDIYLGGIDSQRNR